MFSVALVFLLNTNKLEERVAFLYENADYRSIYHFLSHK